MLGLPEGWESDYDGQRWLYRYKANGQVRYHFPQPGDEFPDFVDDDDGDEDLEPEARLASEQQLKRRDTSDDPAAQDEGANGAHSSHGGPDSDASAACAPEHDNGMRATGYFDPYSFMYFDSGGLDDLSPDAEAGTEGTAATAGANASGAADKAGALPTPPSSKSTPAVAMTAQDKAGEADSPSELPGEPSRVRSPLGVVPELASGQTLKCADELAPSELDAINPSPALAELPTENILAEGRGSSTLVADPTKNRLLPETLAKGGPSEDVEATASVDAAPLHKDQTAGFAEPKAAESAPSPPKYRPWSPEKRLTGEALSEHRLSLSSSNFTVLQSQNSELGFEKRAFADHHTGLSSEPRPQKQPPPRPPKIKNSPASSASRPSSYTQAESTTSEADRRGSASGSGSVAQFPPYPDTEYQTGSDLDLRNIGNPSKPQGDGLSYFPSVLKPAHRRTNSPAAWANQSPSRSQSPAAAKPTPPDPKQTLGNTEPAPRHVLHRVSTMPDQLSNHTLLPGAHPGGGQGPGFLVSQGFAPLNNNATAGGAAQAPADSSHEMQGRTPLHDPNDHFARSRGHTVGATALLPDAAHLSQSSAHAASSAHGPRPPEPFVNVPPVVAPLRPRKSPILGGEPAGLGRPVGRPSFSAQHQPASDHSPADDTTSAPQVSPLRLAKSHQQLGKSAGTISPAGSEDASGPHGAVSTALAAVLGGGGNNHAVSRSSSVAHSTFAPSQMSSPGPSVVSLHRAPSAASAQSPPPAAPEETQTATQMQTRTGSTDSTAPADPVAAAEDIKATPTPPPPKPPKIAAEPAKPFPMLPGQVKPMPSQIGSAPVQLPVAPASPSSRPESPASAPSSRRGSKPSTTPPRRPSDAPSSSSSPKKHGSPMVNQSAADDSGASCSSPSSSTGGAMTQDQLHRFASQPVPDETATSTTSTTAGMGATQGLGRGMKKWARKILPSKPSSKDIPTGRPPIVALAPQRVQASLQQTVAKSQHRLSASIIPGASLAAYTNGLQGPSLSPSQSTDNLSSSSAAVSAHNRSSSAAAAMPSSAASTSLQNLSLNNSATPAAASSSTNPAFQAVPQYGFTPAPTAATDSIAPVSTLHHGRAASMSMPMPPSIQLFAPPVENSTTSQTQYQYQYQQQQQPSELPGASSGPIYGTEPLGPAPHHQRRHSATYSGPAPPVAATAQYHYGGGAPAVPAYYHAPPPTMTMAAPAVSVPAYAAPAAPIAPTVSPPAPPSVSPPAPPSVSPPAAPSVSPPAPPAPLTAAPPIPRPVSQAPPANAWRTASHVDYSGGDWGDDWY